MSPYQSNRWGIYYQFFDELPREYRLYLTQIDDYCAHEETFKEMLSDQVVDGTLQPLQYYIDKFEKSGVQ